MKLRLVLTLFLGSGALLQFGTSSTGLAYAQQIVASGSANGVLNPVACSLANPPSWCAGSDIGAWTNAAIGALPGKCGEIYIPAAKTPYAQTTTIVYPRCVKLRGGAGFGTVLEYTPKNGWALIATDGSGEGNYPGGSLEDLTFQGPGSGTATGGIYIGGSDGSPGAPPQTLVSGDLYGDFVNINRVRIGGNKAGFGTGVQWGNNAWSTTIFESLIDGNGTGVYFPSTTTNSGERLVIANTAIQNNRGIGIKLANSPAVDMHLIGDSIDYNGLGCSPANNCATGWNIQNGNSSGTAQLSMIGGHLEAASQWIQNYGQMTLDATDLLNGSKYAALGYLIDNQNAGMTVIGGFVHPTGRSAVLNNPSGVPAIWIGVNSAVGINNAATVMDRFGNDTLSSAYIKTLNQTAASRYAGTSACSGGLKEITFGTTYASQPVILVFDETTSGGASLRSKSTKGFTVTCSGQSDVFDWMAIGNPN
jgi:hypothetical protein